jgi:putative tryptophan/tyrosine transport system substrate-binding protein
MRRREFIAGLGAAAWPVVARAQQPAMPVIGYVGAQSADDAEYLAVAFREGLNETGYFVGQNVAIEYRWANGQYKELPELVADLIRRRVTVIAALAGPSAVAAKAATTTIPVAFEVGVDPVGIGLVDSLSRPGSNITGVTNLNVELGPKKLELLHKLVPTAPRIAALINPANPNSEGVQKGVQAAARALGVEVDVLRASTEREIDTAFASLVQARAGGLFISPDPFFVGRTKQLAALTVRHAVPAVFEFREFVAAGGLISYGSNMRDAYRLVGRYVGRILKGDKPADLPVQQATKVELIINLKTAKALGLTIPETLLATADEVIQ